MLSPSVSDMLKILDKIPEWIGLKRQLGRIDALEKRVAELEAKGAAEVIKAQTALCIICGSGEMKVIGSKPDPVFGVAGIQQITTRCSECGYQEEKQSKP